MELFQGELAGSGFTEVYSNGRRYFWLGFIYVDGFSGQEESVVNFANNLNVQPLEQAVAALKG